MKKFTIIIAVLMMSFPLFSQKNTTRIGVFGAVPLGNTSDVSKVGIGVEGGYVFLSSGKFDFGVASGISFFGGKKVSYYEANTLKTFVYNSATYIPLVATLRFHSTKELYVGMDLGYAIGFGKGIKGGFQFKPRVGLQLSEHIGVNASFTGLKTKSNTWKTFGVGLEFRM